MSRSRLLKVSLLVAVAAAFAAIAVRERGGSVHTGPPPAGGYNTSKVTYKNNRWEHFPKIDVNVGEYVVTPDTKPIHFEMALSAKNTEVLTFHGTVRGQPQITKTHVLNITCTKPWKYGVGTSGVGGGRFQTQGEIAAYSITGPVPRTPGQYRVLVTAVRCLRDDGTVQPEDEPESTVIAEGELEVRADDEKAKPTPDPRF